MSRGASRRRRRRRRHRRRVPARDRPVDLDRYRAFVPEWERFLDAASRPEPIVVRARSGRIDPEQLVRRLGRRGFRLREVEGLPAFFQVEEGPRHVSATLEHWNGLVYVQQASTGVAAPALGPEPGERVLDLCAAPGGKTTHISELMADRGCLVACEVSESRIRGLLGNVYRLAHPNVLVVAGDGRDLPDGALFDRVLVDAPCSGEGTLRRRAGHPPDQSRSFLEYVTRAQRALLERAVRVTRPGGVVLYVTCTFAPEENEAVVSEALSRLPVELEALDLPVAHAPGLTSFEGRAYDPRLEGAARIYPHHLDSGGLFLARLRRLEGDGAPADAVRARTDAWSRVPPVFPGDRAAADADATAEVRRAVTEVCERFGVKRDLSGVGWTLRGGRVWAHTAGEWPLEAWPRGRWRPVSIGLRAIEFDGRGRPRPTNDFLRWACGGSTAVELDRDSLEALLRGEALSREERALGPIALSLGGEVIGRGAVTREGLKSEIPKARARDLTRALAPD